MKLEETTHHQDKCSYHSLLEPQRGCTRPVLKGFDKCFWHAPCATKYDPGIMEQYFNDSRTLKELIELEVSRGGSLEGAFLKGADIGGNWFNKGANLEGADLRWANLSEAGLSYGSLRNANLSFANLESAYLSDVDIRGAIFTEANLFNVKFRNNDFSGVKGLSKESFRGWEWGFFPIYHILEDYPEYSKWIYRSLVSYFARNAALDDASWAAYRERIAHRQLLLKELSLTRVIIHSIVRSYVRREVFSRRRVFSALIHWLGGIKELILSYIYCYTFGYGEKPLRVILSSMVVIFAYALIYYWFSIPSEKGFANALYFSIASFTPLNSSGLIYDIRSRYIVASESITGTIFIGLFLFALARRAVGRG